MKAVVSFETIWSLLTDSLAGLNRHLGLILSEASFYAGRLVECLAQLSSLLYFHIFKAHHVIVIMGVFPLLIRICRFQKWTERFEVGTRESPYPSADFLGGVWLFSLPKVLFSYVLLHFLVLRKHFRWSVTRRSRRATCHFGTNADYIARRLWLRRFLEHLT